MDWTWIGCVDIQQMSGAAWDVTPGSGLDRVTGPCASEETWRGVASKRKIILIRAHASTEVTGKQGQEEREEREMMMPDGTLDPLCWMAAFPGPFILRAGCDMWF